MIDLFQITGSSSFAVRCAFEEIGAGYRASDIAPRERSQPPELALGGPSRGAYLRSIAWHADTLRPLWERIMAPFFFTTESQPGVRAKGLEELAGVGASLEAELAGWQDYKPGLALGGEAVAAPGARVGARAAIARSRALDDLDERLLRHHPELRGGKPVAAPVVDLG